MFRVVLRVAVLPTFRAGPRGMLGRGCWRRRQAHTILGQTTSSQCSDRRWTCQRMPNQMSPVPPEGLAQNNKQQNSKITPLFRISPPVAQGDNLCFYFVGVNRKRKGRHDSRASLSKPHGYQDSMTMTMTHSEKSIQQTSVAWPYRRERRGRDPAKKKS